MLYRCTAAGCPPRCLAVRAGGSFVMVPAAGSPGPVRMLGVVVTFRLFADLFDESKLMNPLASRAIR